MSASLKIAEGMMAVALRHWARRCGNGRAAARAYAIAHALDGLDRAQAARLAGMERQALRDAVRRYNAEGGRRPVRPTQGPPGGVADRCGAGDFDGRCVKGAR